MADYGILRAGTLASAGAATLALSADQYLIEWVIIQVAAQQNNVSVGNDTQQTWELTAGGEPLELRIDRLDRIFVRFPAGGSRVNWLAGSVR